MKILQKCFYINGYNPECTVEIIRPSATDVKRSVKDYQDCMILLELYLTLQMWRRSGSIPYKLKYECN